MAVKPKSKVQRKRVKALTDPKPEFVSLVMAGANMTPFTSVKADGVEEVVAKADTHEIVHIVFAKAEYADADAVKAWLTAGGYPDDTEVVEREDAFVVGELVPGSSAVAHGNVTVYLAEREQPEAKAEPVVDADTSPTAVTAVQPVAKSDEPVVVVASERVVKSLYAIPALIELVSALRWVVDDLTYEAAADAAEGDEAEYAPVLTQLKASATSMLNGLSALCNVEVAELHTAFKAVEPVAAPAVEAPAVEAPAETPVVEAEKTEETAAVEPAAETVTITELPADAPVTTDTVQLAAAETPVVEAPATPAPDLAAIVAQLADSVQELTKTVGRLHNEAAAKSDDLVGRVTAIESERQSRRGADDDELPAGKPNVSTKATGLGDLTLRAVLGASRRRP